MRVGITIHLLVFLSYIHLKNALLTNAFVYRCNAVSISAEYISSRLLVMEKSDQDFFYPDSIWNSRRDIGRALFSPIAVNKVKIGKESPANKPAVDDQSKKNALLFSVFLIASGALIFRLGLELDLPSPILLS